MSVSAEEVKGEKHLSVCGLSQHEIHVCACMCYVMLCCAVFATIVVVANRK